MAGGTRELTNPADMPRSSQMNADDLIPAARADGTPVALRGAAFVGAGSNVVRSDNVDNIVKLTQSAYNALNPKSATTLYIIVG